MPIFWWLRSFAYVKFISRELTSVFVGYAAVVLLVQARALARGDEAYDRFLSWLHSVPVVVLHVVVLIAVVFHAVTWLNLAPKALVIRIAGRTVPQIWVLVGHYAAWLAASVLIFWVLLG